MLRSLTLTVALVLVLTMSSTMSSGPEDEPKSQGDNKEDGIKAEVSGTLDFETGRGYFISVERVDKAEQKMRVWLWHSEASVLVRKLEGLHGKKVIAKGKLAQLSERLLMSVPPLGMYLESF